MYSILVDNGRHNPVPGNTVSTHLHLLQHVSALFHALLVICGRRRRTARVH